MGREKTSWSDPFASICETVSKRREIEVCAIPPMRHKRVAWGTEVLIDGETADGIGWSLFPGLYFLFPNPYSLVPVFITRRR